MAIAVHRGRGRENVGRRNRKSSSASGNGGGEGKARAAFCPGSAAGTTARADGRALEGKGACRILRISPIHCYPTTCCGPIVRQQIPMDSTDATAVPCRLLLRCNSSTATYTAPRASCTDTPSTSSPPTSSSHSPLLVQLTPHHRQTCRLRTRPPQTPRRTSTGPTQSSPSTASTPLVPMPLPALASSVPPSSATSTPLPVRCS